MVAMANLKERLIGREYKLRIVCHGRKKILNMEIYAFLSFQLSSYPACLV